VVEKHGVKKKYGVLYQWKCKKGKLIKDFGHPQKKGNLENDFSHDIILDLEAMLEFLY
jgi:hypothetical protein